MTTMTNTEIKNLGHDRVNVVKIPLSELKTVYERDQHKLRFRVIEDIVKNFDERLLLPLVVSHRANQYYIIDGVLRYVALTKMSVDEVGCFVVDLESYDDELKLWWTFQKAR